MNAETGVATVRRTDQRGHYLFDLVLPGSYEIAVELAGFSRFLQRNILVQTRADVTVNARLELGAVSQTVTVDATPVQVNFNTTSMELTMDTKTIQQMPLIDRSPFLLAALDPAVQLRYHTTTPYGFWSLTSIETGGSHTNRANEALLDGNPAQLSQKGSSPSFRQNTVPTALERERDFSRTMNTQGGLRQIFDPFTTVFDALSDAGQVFRASSATSGPSLWAAC